MSSVTKVSFTSSYPIWISFFPLFWGLETVSIEAGNQGNCETQLVCFLHISDQYPFGPDTQFLKNHSHLYVYICKHVCICMYVYIYI